ncbi:MAG: four helix bundle protein [Bacteroidetes bacterium]|nr:four helix bundle protein [Bacteroidota bacterium]
MKKASDKDFDIYLRTRMLSVRLLKFCRDIRKQKIEYFLQDQLARSGTSIGANIHEGRGSSSQKEFCRFFEIAIRSALETEYWLNVLDEINSFSETNDLKAEVQEIRKVLSAIVLGVKRNMAKDENKDQPEINKSK